MYTRGAHARTTAFIINRMAFLANVILDRDPGAYPPSTISRYICREYRYLLAFTPTVWHRRTCLWQSRQYTTGIIDSNRTCTSASKIDLICRVSARESPNATVAMTLAEFSLMIVIVSRNHIDALSVDKRAARNHPMFWFNMSHVIRYTCNFTIYYIKVMCILKFIN